jgi:hypothetical protein
MKRFALFLLIAALICFPVLVSAHEMGKASTSSGWRLFGAEEEQIPTITIVRVVDGQSVTIQTADFPADDTFVVYMSSYGSLGISGTIVDTIDSGEGGTFSKTFSIPEGLKEEPKIAIRLESPQSGYYAYNWFFNNTTGPGDLEEEETDQAAPVQAEESEAPPAEEEAPVQEQESQAPAPADQAAKGQGQGDQGVTKGASSGGYTGYPTFMIAEVTKDQDVTIKGSNFPANDTFTVRMNYYGTLGIGGTVVETITTGSGGSFSDTYSIPAKYHGQYKIAIRLESSASGYYAYNWFYNNTTGGGGGGGGTGYTGYPYFYIDTVTQDQAVAINAHNFPANDTFNLRMNYYGTQGIAGVIVQTVTTDANGNLSDTVFPVPSEVQGSYKIAIRLESPTSGYYAYNWFYNNTTSPPAPAP